MFICRIFHTPPLFIRNEEGGSEQLFLGDLKGRIPHNIEATKIGALDFLEKPIALQKLLSTVDRALKHGEMQMAAGLSFDKLGNSPVIQEFKQQLEPAVKKSGPVLLSGETGSPFEIVARYFHKSGTPWVGLSRVEFIANAPLELLQKASGGTLYLNDAAQYSKNIQNGISLIEIGRASCRERV